MQKIGATGDGKSAVATPEGKQPKEEEEFRSQFTSGRETTVPTCRTIGQVFLELHPSEKLKFYP